MYPIYELQFLTQEANVGVVLWQAIFWIAKFNDFMNLGKGTGIREN